MTESGSGEILQRCFTRVMLDVGVVVRACEAAGEEGDALRATMLDLFRAACETEGIPEECTDVMLKLFKHAERCIFTNRWVVFPWVEKRLAEHEASGGEE